MLRFILNINRKFEIQIHQFFYYNRKISEIFDYYVKRRNLSMDLIEHFLTPLNFCLFLEKIFHFYTNKIAQRIIVGIIESKINHLMSSYRQLLP